MQSLPITNTSNGMEISTLLEKVGDDCYIYPMPFQTLHLNAQYVKKIYLSNTVYNSTF